MILNNNNDNSMEWKKLKQFILKGNEIKPKKIVLKPKDIKT